MEENNQEAPKSTNNKLWIAIAIIIVVALLASQFLLGSKKTSKESPTPTSTELQTGVIEESSMPTGSLKEFTVDGSSYQFVPSTITVNKGDSVKITFRDQDARHDLVIDGD